MFAYLTFSAIDSDGPIEVVLVAIGAVVLATACLLGAMVCGLLAVSPSRGARFAVGVVILGAIGLPMIGSLASCFAALDFSARRSPAEQTFLAFMFYVGPFITIGAAIGAALGFALDAGRRRVASRIPLSVPGIEPPGAEGG